jgi:feruloyl esterase
VGSSYYWVFGPGWDWRSFDFDRDVAQVDDVLAGILNANSPDLSRFQARGGKLLGFHGWADALVPPQDFVDYYLRVGAFLRGNAEQATLPDNSDLVSNVIQARFGAEETASDGSVDHQRAQRFFRLFMVPGMGHCGGGPGPNLFYNGTFSPVPADAQHNSLLALQRWVEEGAPPRPIIATKYVNDDPTQGVAQTRPLCAFPRVAHYRGQGDVNDAASFACVRGGNQDNPMPAPEYLR